MRTRLQVPPGLIQLVREQAGVVSRRQSIGFGLTPTVLGRLVASGLWGRLETGIYLVPDVEPSWLGRVWGGVLIGGPDARVGGRTAAALLGLVDDRLLPIEILIPFGRRLADRPWLLFRQERDRVRAAS